MCTFLLEQLITAQLDETFPASMEPQISLISSDNHSKAPYSELAESTPHELI